MFFLIFFSWTQAHIIPESIGDQKYINIDPIMGAYASSSDEAKTIMEGLIDASTVVLQDAATVFERPDLFDGVMIYKAAISGAYTILEYGRLDTEHNELRYRSILNYDWRKAAQTIELIANTRQAILGSIDAITEVTKMLDCVQSSEDLIEALKDLKDGWIFLKKLSADDSKANIEACEKDGLVWVDGETLSQDANVTKNEQKSTMLGDCFKYCVVTAIAMTPPLKPVYIAMLGYHMVTFTPATDDENEVGIDHPVVQKIRQLGRNLLNYATNAPVSFGMSVISVAPAPFNSPATLYELWRLSMLAKLYLSKKIYGDPSSTTIPDTSINP